MKRSIVFGVLISFSLVYVWSQYINRDTVRVGKVINYVDPGLPLVGSEAPSFTAESTNGEINFPADFGKTWKIIFAHPRDFTPVCSSELLELAYEQDDFARLGVKLLVLSHDDLNTHISWKEALESIEYKGRDRVKIKFPIVVDENLAISVKYGMVPHGHMVGSNIRSIFFIDPQNTVRAVIHYPNEVGRSTAELKRALVALQTTYSQQDVVTPANWKPGDDVMIRYISSGEKPFDRADSKLYQYSWFMTFRKSE